ncbi:hydroxyacid dehydrogenase [Nocardioides turkmenicus]
MTGTDARPVALLGMEPGLVAALFDAASIARLNRLTTIQLGQLQHGVLDRDAVDPDTEVMLTCWGAPQLDVAALDALPKLRAVVHAAGSVKGIVTSACRERGIEVSSAASVNALPVAEYTLAMILLANKRVPWLARTYRDMRAGWHPRVVPESVGNFGLTVGIVGASLIGRRVIELLRPFDLEVILHDPYVDQAQAAGLGVELVDLDQLCARSHVVSLHAPALPSTRHMFDARRLGLMRDGATLINTARGHLVDTDALTEELVSGRLNAVLDHTEPEILPTRSVLYGLPNVVLTPHIAGSQGNELRRMGSAAIDELERFVNGQPFEHPVDYDALERSA